MALQEKHRRIPDWPGRSKGRRIAAFLLLYLLAVLASPSLLMVLPVGLLWWGINQNVSWGWLRRVLLLGLIYLVVMESAILLFMVRDRIQPVRVSGTETMIIPGSAIIGDQPGYYLKSRLDAALPVLKQYPGIQVVVSGRRAPGDEYSEAAVMRRYLMGQGIAPARIFEEPQGQDTIRNFEYSKAVLASNGLSAQILIVTNEFHSFRSSAIARTIGLSPRSIPAPSPDGLFYKYMLREFLSLLKVQLHYGLSLR